jgi:hypothetical protein
MLARKLNLREIWTFLVIYVQAKIIDWLSIQAYA